MHLQLLRAPSLACKRALAAAARAQPCMQACTCSCCARPASRASVHLQLLRAPSLACKRALAAAARAQPRPGILTGSELSAKVNKQRMYFLLQSDCLSKISLPPQEVNSKPLTFENNPKKLILHCFRRHQKNNFNQEQCLKFRPIRGRVEG